MKLWCYPQSSLKKRFTENSPKMIRRIKAMTSLFQPRQCWAASAFETCLLHQRKHPHIALAHCP